MLHQRFVQRVAVNYDHALVAIWNWEHNYVAFILSVIESRIMFLNKMWDCFRQNIMIIILLIIKSYIMSLNISASMHKYLHINMFLISYTCRSESLQLYFMMFVTFVVLLTEMIMILLFIFKNKSNFLIIFVKVSENQFIIDLQFAVYINLMIILSLLSFQKITYLSIVQSSLTEHITHYEIQCN